jgi:protein O-GlcNAc transferase
MSSSSRSQGSIPSEGSQQRPKLQSLSIDQALQRGVAYHQAGKWHEAQQIYGAILKVVPEHFDALNLLGAMAAQTGRYEEAVDYIGRAVKVNPKIAAAHSNLANALKGLGRLDEALQHYDRAIELEPGYAEAYYNRGNTLKATRESMKALADYDKAIELRPDYVAAIYNRANTLLDMGLDEAAVQSYDQAIALKPDHAAAYNNRGSALRELGRLNEALVSHEQALALQADFAEAANNRGNVLLDLEEPEAALRAYEQALEIHPAYAQAQYNRGNAFLALGRCADAVSAYDAALGLQADYPEALNNRGHALHALHHLEEAIASFDHAISLRPDYAEAYNNLGNVLVEQGRLEDALVRYEQALARQPDYAEAHYNRGNLLLSLQRPAESLQSLTTALSVKPDAPYWYGAWVNAKMRVCDWSGWSIDRPILSEALRKGQPTATPFPMLALFDDPELHRQAAEAYIVEEFGEESLQALPARANALTSESSAGDSATAPVPQRIRVGYFSSDFHDHATAYLMAELLESHDREQFEVFAFSWEGDHADSSMRRRLKAALEHWISLDDMSDEEAAALARSHQLDIAVDLKGFTQGARTAMFLEGCAPIQVSYLGYPGTLGTRAINYIVADDTVIPAADHSAYAEAVAYLPGCYQVNDAHRVIAEQIPSRPELGLPESAFVFCCFNNNYKINPEVFDAWMQILRAVPDAVLWLLEDNVGVADNLRREASARGVAPDRLVFARRVGLADHLARHAQADLFLDTWPYNAHTTASDALWAGLPVLTKTGRSFAARVATSLLKALHMDGALAMNSVDSYVARAVTLATDSEQLRVLKSALQARKHTSSLFQARPFAAQLEAAYRAMLAKHQEGKPAGEIRIP